MEFAIGFACGVTATLFCLSVLMYRIYVLFRYGP